MRQNKQTKDDAKFRTALENMRYQNCTQNDIAFLRTCIVGPGNNRPKLAEKRFQNVSMITTWNAQEDKVNMLGCIQFSEDAKLASTLVIPGQNMKTLKDQKARGEDVRRSSLHQYT